VQWQERIVKLRSMVKQLLRLRRRVLLLVRQHLLRAHLLDVLYQLQVHQHLQLVVTQLSREDSSKNPERYHKLKVRQTHIQKRKLR
jgi:CO dehydrogenase/acetyl-CoA synthase epsilon subunit